MYSEIDHSMFVLNVDLWSEDGKREVNLVRSSSGNPALSSTTPFSYSTLNGGDTPPVPFGQPVLPPGRDATYNSPMAVGYVQDYQVQSNYGHGKRTFPARAKAWIDFVTKPTYNSCTFLPAQRLVWPSTAILSTAPSLQI